MKAAEQLITDNLDTWSSAIKARSSSGRGSSNKIDLYGINKLRDLILELAVRGLLVPQDPNDEPASILMENIQSERQLLVSKKKTKRVKELPAISSDEHPYILPLGWEWVRLQQIIQISSGNGLTSSKMNDQGSVPVFGGNGITGWHDAGNVDKPTLVIGRVGYYCGSVHITPPSAWVTDNAFITTFSEDNIHLSFLSLLLKGTNLKENESATAQPVISGRKLYPIVIGLPPKAEQHRIVAKVDELMTLCDALEAQKKDSITAHQTLVETLLSALTNSGEKGEFNQAWSRIAEHFDTLFTTEYSIDQLKQTILQLAVMGKLVPQDPNDEPASDLLKNINELKAKLINDGKLKKQSKLEKISMADKPFILPNGWEWARFGSCVVLKSGVSFSKDKEQEDGEYPYCKVGDMNLFENRYSLTTSTRFIDPSSKEMNSIIPAGSIAFPKRGGAIATNKKRYIENPLFVDLNIMCATPFSPLSIHYVMTWLDGIDLAALNTGTSVPQINNKDVEPLLFPCPPENEQKRIVEKVDELMSLCEQLESCLSEAQSIQLHLADSISEITLDG